MMTWSKGIADWIEGDTAFVSSVFSWNVQKAYMLCRFYEAQGYHVRVGGPTVYQFPGYFTDFDTSGTVDALSHHNPLATFTSRGCIRHCSFCLVPWMEGNLVELDDWPVRPIICDNNLLATSYPHFDKVIDRLLEKQLIGIDFNQGLDARLLTDYHAKRLAELPKDTIIRLAWDNIKLESVFDTAWETLVSAGIRFSQIRVYVLIGYKDTPEDARYRLEKVRHLGGLPNPMRFQPINTLRRNTYREKGWSEYLLKKYMRYYSNLGLFRNVGFDEYDYNKADTESLTEKMF